MHGGDGMFIRIKFQVNLFILIHLGLKSTPFFFFFAKDWLCTKLTGIVIFVLHSSRLLRGNYTSFVGSVFPADRKGRLMDPGDSQGIEINKESHGAFVVMETLICTWRYCHYIFIAFSPLPSFFLPFFISNSFLWFKILLNVFSYLKNALSLSISFLLPLSLSVSPMILIYCFKKMLFSMGKESINNGGSFDSIWLVLL